MRKFVSDDGSSVLFQSSVSGEMYATEAEAIADENAAQYELKVDAFVSSKEWKRGQDTRATALITEFLAWCDTAAGQSLLAQVAAGTYQKSVPAVAEVPPAPAAPAMPEAA